ncbi:MAG: hypothetical protein JST04_08540 [Bdellovibrionales bacterium]|nr:hypothetical protein [Bdellovibrionales bacterium]
MSTSTHASSSHSSTPHEEGEMDLVATWLVFDLPRTIAGAMAGIFAGLVAWTFAGFLAKAGGYEFWFPFKVPAAVVLGRDALTYGMTHAVFVGTFIHCFICAVLGMVYSHFVKSNRLDALLGAGFMWGTFSWVFINNLFVRSFLHVREMELPNGPAFFILLVFGFSLASLKVFDRILCGRAR